MVLDLKLTNGAHEFKLALEEVIQTNYIDPQKVANINSFVFNIPEYKNEIIKRGNLIDSVMAFSGLNALDSFINLAKKHLEEKENPKSAKDLIKFFDDIIALTNQIDIYIQNPQNTSANQINSLALNLREKMRSKGFIKTTKKQLQN
jgi:hypothetical protein